MKAVFVVFGFALCMAMVNGQNMMEYMLMSNLLGGGAGNSGSTGSGSTMPTGLSGLPTNAGTSGGLSALLGGSSRAGGAGGGNRAAAAAAMAALRSRSGGRGLGNMLMMRNLGFDQYLEYTMCSRFMPSLFCLQQSM